MLSRIREQLGTAGFIIAIVALVAALGGGAYAASGGLNSKQKKEVTKIAKQNAGKPGAPGSTGPQGPAGAAGKDGAAGANGKDGAAGTPGAPGTSVTTTQFIGAKGGCPEGGFEAKSASPPAFACNGKPGEEGPEGPPGVCGASPCNLPKGVTETGSFYIRGELREPQTAPIGWSIPLTPADAAAITYHVAGANGDATCAGKSTNPTAPPGKLCFYIAEGFGLPGFDVKEMAPVETSEFNVSTSGALIYIESAVSSTAFAEGSFAITAPAAP